MTGRTLVACSLICLVVAASAAAQTPSPAPTPAPSPTPVVAPAAQPEPVTATPRAARAPRAPQAPAAPAAPAVAPAPPPGPRPQGQLANVQVDVVITDRGPEGPENRRVISATAADGERSSVRNSAEVRVGGNYRPSGLSLDVRPALAEGNRVRLDVGLEFQLVEHKASGSSAADADAPAFGSVRLTQHIVLESGKPLMISQSTAPGTQRTVTVEVKATVLK